MSYSENVIGVGKYIMVNDVNFWYRLLYFFFLCIFRLGFIFELMGIVVIFVFMGVLVILIEKFFSG